MLWLGTWLMAAVATAAPPSSTLSGPDGTLKWQVSKAGGVVTVVGSSPKWKVEHTADLALRPKATKRTNPNGEVMTVTWEGAKVTVTLPQGKQVVHEKAGLWDLDTVDIRMGERVRKGLSLDHTFAGVDSTSGTLYRFDAVDKGPDTCPSGACQRVNMTLAGWRKYVGPSIDMWFAADGSLVKFDGPAGKFAK